MFSLPAGTVTFLLGDVEGSTRAPPRGGPTVVSRSSRLDRAIDESVGVHGGVRAPEQGEGDSFVAAFDRPGAALAAAAAIQRALRPPEGREPRLQVRLAVHTGEVTVRDGHRYAGLALTRCARIRDCGHGAQTLVSATTAALVGDRLPDGLRLADLGEHRLGDLARPERIFQLTGPGLPLRSPPLRVLDDTPNNLPVQLTSFVGRDDEVRTLGGALLASRLVTLTGPGGSGKTRLAVQVAAANADRYDAVWFVDLAGVASGDGDQGDEAVLAAVAAAIGARPGDGEPPGAVVTHALRDGRTLMLLDNCEHLAAPSARVAELLLRSAPGLTIMATSRQPLGASGEHIRGVPSLSLPARDVELGPVALEGSEAVALFVERARQVRPSFAIDSANREAVARICRRLDGIPLAIELAAARVRLLTPDQIAGALDDRFRLLTGAPRTAVPRQATLRSSIDWSHDLLDHDERVVFRRLAVFAGPFSLEDAEAVAGAPVEGGSHIDAWHVLDRLASLVDRSMVVAEDVDGKGHYRLLDSLRAYGLERLDEAGERAAVNDAHLARMAAVAAAMAPLHGRRHNLVQPGSRAADLEVALRWAKQNGRPEHGRLAGHMAELWRRAWPQRALELADGAISAIESSGAPPYGPAWTLAMVLSIGHDPGPGGAAGLERLRRNVEALRLDPGTDSDELATAEAFASLFASRYGDGPPVEQLVAISRYAATTGNGRLAGSVRFHLLQAARQEGDLALLARVAHEVLTAPDQEGGLSLALPFAAYHPLTLGRVDEAEDVARAALEDRNAATRAAAHDVLATAAFHREDRQALVEACSALAEIADGAPFTENSLRYARTLLAVHDGTEAVGTKPSAVPTGLDHRSLEALVHAVGATPAAALALLPGAQVPPHSLGGIARSSLLPLVHRRLGQPAAAAIVIREALAGRLHQPDIAWADILAELVALLADHGDPTDAARVVGIRDRHLADTGARIGWIPSRLHDESRHRLVESLGAERARSCAAEGRALPPPAAMAVVVSLADGVVAATRRREAAPFGWESLTVAERRVVDLVAQGRTNRETAEALGIKTSTVHTHLLHVYAKLGIGSRAELAVAHTRERLTRQGRA